MRCPRCGEAHAPVDCPRGAPLPAGSRLDDKYVVVRYLAAGGMGVVYEVEHRGIGRRFAAKVLDAEFARRRDLVERFRREARAASAIGNEHIVEVTDLGEVRTPPADVPFIVMELLRGKTLGQLIAADKRVAPPRAVAIAKQLLDALAAAHAAGIVHRDLKPDNLFLLDRPADFVKVLDFGISRFRSDEARGDLTATGAVVGTPSYMSPEQARGETADHRADLYGVGAILYRALTGARPYKAPNLHQMLFAIADGKLVPPRRRVPSLPESLEAVVLRAMAVERGARYQSAGEMREALEALTLDEDPTREWIAPPLRAEDGPSLPGELLELDEEDESPAGFAPSGAPSPSTLSPSSVASASGDGRWVPPPSAIAAPTPQPAASAPLPAPPATASASAGMGPPPAATGAAASRTTWLVAAGFGTAALLAIACAMLLVRSLIERRHGEEPRGQAPAVEAVAPAPVVTPTLCHLTVAAEPLDARLSVDGAIVPPGSFDVRRDGLRHVLHAEAEGYSPVDVAFLATGDQTLTVKLKRRAKGGGKQRIRNIDGDEVRGDDPSVKAIEQLVNGLKDSL